MVIYYTERGEGESFLRRALAAYGAEGEILRTDNGKPYLASGDVQFSLTDTDGLIAVAVGRRTVGLDAEKVRPRKLDAVLSRLAPEEREEDFFELWTAKEAYVKFLGGTLAALLPHLTYKKGVLFLQDVPIGATLKHFMLDGCMLCLCTEAEEKISLVRL